MYIFVHLFLEILNALNIMKLAVIGITCLVGQEIVRVLEDFDLSFTTFLPVASERSVGKKVTVREKEYTISGLEEAVEAAPDVAIFSAGGSVSLEGAARFAEKGTFVGGMPGGVAM